MKYTKNLPLKLRSLGFQKSYDNSHNDGDDDDLKYEVWNKGAVEVTVGHNPIKTVDVYVECQKNIKCATLEKLSMLDKMLNK